MHYMGGIKYIFLATIAGIGYGWIYNKTHLQHFLNLTPLPQ